MKKIGFVDYCMDEWHANNYPAWIEEANKTLGTDYRVAYAWAEKELGFGTAAWCERFGTEPCATVEELCTIEDFGLITAECVTNFFSHPQKTAELAITATAQKTLMILFISFLLTNTVKPCGTVSVSMH